VPEDKIKTITESLKENDVIVAYGRGKILGIGLVISPYFYDNSRERAVFSMKEEIRYPHRYKVKWICKKEVAISNDSILYGNPPKAYGTLTTEDTVHKIVDDYTINKIEKLLEKELF